MSITDVDHYADEMPLERLEAEITELCGHLTAGECRWLLLIAEYDRRKGYETWGCHSIVQWLGWKCGFKETNESYKQRYFRLDPCDDGSFVINGRICAESAAIVMAAIEAAQHLTSDGSVDKGGSAEPPDVNNSAKSPKSTTNADAFVMMAESFLANGASSRTAGDRYQIVVNVDADVLADNSEGTCELDGGPSICPETARRLSCDASIVEMTEDEDTQPRQLAKRTRAIPPSIRRAVHLRDQGCRFPGCGSRIYVDVHHIKHWAHGGTHEMKNLVELCWHHHRLVHEGGWGIKQINKANGMGIESETCIPNWYGDPLNLNDIISGLWYVDHPPELN